jgi:hypothetical protein
MKIKYNGTEFKKEQNMPFKRPFERTNYVKKHSY